MTRARDIADRNFADNDKVVLGNGDDLEISHNATNSIIENKTGYLALRSQDGGQIRIEDTSGNASALFNDNADVKLRYASSDRLVTTSAGVTITGDASFADNGKAKFGAGNDLQIYHSGSASFVAEAGAGGLNIGGSTVSIQNAALDENMAVFTQDGAVELYHNNSKKFETTSTGFTAKGNIMPDTDSSRDIGDTGSRFDQIYGDFVYVTPNMNNASAAGGFNLVEVAAYDDNSSHSLSTSMANKMSVIQIAAGTGLTSFPIYPNGGSGVAFAYNYMDPDSASWNYTTSSISRTVNVAGTSANSFSINITSGGGAFTIQRTSGSRAYCVAISVFQQA